LKGIRWLPVCLPQPSGFGMTQKHSLERAAPQPLSLWNVSWDSSNAKAPAVSKEGVTNRPAVYYSTCGAAYQQSHQVCRPCGRWLHVIRRTPTDRQIRGTCFLLKIRDLAEGGHRSWVSPDRGRAERWFSAEPVCRRCLLPLPYIASTDAATKVQPRNSGVDNRLQPLTYRQNSYPQDARQSELR
jgi:hypothetical protein